MRERDAGHGLRLGAEVVGQPHDAAGVDDGRVGGEVANPPAGQGERLGHGPGHDEPGVPVEQFQGRGPARELLVRLVDDDDRLGAGADLVDDVEAHDRPGRVVGRGDDDHGRLGLPDRVEHEAGVEPEVRAARNGDELGAGVAGVLRVHRVAGREGQHAPPGPAERGEQVGHDLVRSVRRPDAVRGEAVPEVAGQVRAQLGRLPVRVPVEGAGRRHDRRGHLVPDERRRRVRVLVDVEHHRHLELRRAVGFLPDQVRAQRQVRQRDHRGRRTVIACACPGRSSASANRSTPSAMASSASAVYPMTCTVLMNERTVSPEE